MTMPEFGMGFDHDAIQHVAIMTESAPHPVSDVVLIMHLMVDHEVAIDAIANEPPIIMHMHLHGQVQEYMTGEDDDE